MIQNRLTSSDKYLIGALIITAVTLIIFQWLLWPQPPVKQADIYVNGQLVQTLKLRSGYSQQIRIGQQLHYAIIETKDGRVRIREDDSPQQIGVQTGWISKPPQQLINLPYRIVVKVVSSTPPDVDGITR